MGTSNHVMKPAHQGQYLNRVWNGKWDFAAVEVEAAVLTVPSASSTPGIHLLLGGGIHEQLKPKVIPVLDEIQAIATGKHGWQK